MNDVMLREIRGDLSELKQRMTALETQQNMITPAAVVEFKGAVVSSLENLDKDMDIVVKAQESILQKINALEQGLLTLKIKFGLPFGAVLLISVIINVWQALK